MRAFLPVCVLLSLIAAMFALAEDAQVRERTGPTATSQPASQPEPATTQPAPAASRRVHVFISGHVQGVGFRDFTVAAGARLRVTGWVRNIIDGRVEMVAEGPGERIEKLLAAVRVGPRPARVEKVDISDEKPTGEFKGFVRR